MRKRFDVIVAAGIDRSFGKNGVVPFDIPDEFKHYCTLIQYGNTRNTVISGRKSFDPKIPTTRPVENAEYFVISTSLKSIQGARVFPSFRLALAQAQNHIFLVGGNMLLNSILRSPEVALCDKIYFTRIDSCFEADTFLNLFSPDIYSDDFFGPEFTVTYRSKKYFHKSISYEYTAYSNKAFPETPLKLDHLSK